MPKVLVGRSVNRNAVDPLAACLDTVGFCPDVDIHCITTWNLKGKTVEESKSPVGWNRLTDEEKLLWLIGILTSTLAAEISLAGRSARHLESKRLKDFPLPGAVDKRIVTTIRQMLERDQRREPLAPIDPLRLLLDELVEAAYGNPKRVTLQRTGINALYELSQLEAAKPCITVTGQVRDVSLLKGELLMWLQGIRDEADESWLPIPPDIPGWTLTGEVFTANLTIDIERFSQLNARPTALRHFRHTPRPYLTVQELREIFSANKHR